VRRFRWHRSRWWIWLLEQERLPKQEIMLDHTEGRRFS
jgi:hypothetical protein